MTATTDHATEELKRIMRQRHGRRPGSSADSTTNGSPLNGLSTTSTPTSTSTSTSTSRSTSPPIPSTPIGAPIAHPIGQHKTQEEMDREMALQLFQQEQAAIEARRRQREEASKDAELARHLQEEEEKKERQRKEMQQQQQLMSEQEAQRLIQEEAEHEHEHAHEHEHEHEHESEEEEENEIAPRHERGEHGEQLIGGEEEEERESDEALAARLQQEEDEEEQRLAEARARRPHVISFQFGGPNGARRISTSFGGNNHIDGLNGMLMSLLGMYQHQPFIGHHPLFQGLRMNSSDSGSDMSYDDLLALQERIGNVRPANRPAKKEEIEQLPVRTFKAEQKSNSDSKSDTTGDSQKTCCICMSEFEDGDMIRSLPCFHVFHKDEIDQWLLSNEKCPICKLPVSTTDVTETPSSNPTSATSSQPYSAR